MADQDITQSIRDFAALVQSKAEPVMPLEATHPYVVTPAGYNVTSLEKFIFNEYADRPHRTKQAVTVLDPDSFISYWTEFRDGNSRIFADVDGKRFLGVIDYHEPVDGARWLSHSVTLQLRHTEEWKTWTGKNESPMCQADMALFIEDNAPDVVDPTAASMMEVARTLQVNQDVVFDSSVRLTDGSVSFSYREETKTAAAGKISVPERFKIAIPVFEGMDRVEMQARLRYRIPSGKLSMWYSLWRHAKAERIAFDQVMEKITEACGPVLIGKP